MSVGGALTAYLVWTGDHVYRREVRAIPRENYEWRRNEEDLKEVRKEVHPVFRYWQ